MPLPFLLCLGDTARRWFAARSPLLVVVVKGLQRRALQLEGERQDLKAALNEERDSSDLERRVFLRCEDDARRNRHGGQYCVDDGAGDAPFATHGCLDFEETSESIVVRRGGGGRVPGRKDRRGLHAGPLDGGSASGGWTPAGRCVVAFHHAREVR
jgi:hypothetical protein